MKFKTVEISINGGHFNKEKIMIFKQLASVAGCVQSFMLAQKCRPRISEYWPKFIFLLEKQIKIYLNPKYLIYRFSDELAF